MRPSGRQIGVIFGKVGVIFGGLLKNEAVAPINPG